MYDGVFFAKRSILDDLQGSKHASAPADKTNVEVATCSVSQGFLDLSCFLQVRNSSLLEYL